MRPLSSQLCWRTMQFSDSESIFHLLCGDQKTCKGKYSLQRSACAFDRSDATPNVWQKRKLLLVGSSESRRVIEPFLQLYSALLFSERKFKIADSFLQPCVLLVKVLLVVARRTAYTSSTLLLFQISHCASNIFDLLRLYSSFHILFDSNLCLSWLWVSDSQEKERPNFT